MLFSARFSLYLIGYPQFHMLTAHFSSRRSIMELPSSTPIDYIGVVFLYQAKERISVTAVVR